MKIPKRNRKLEIVVVLICLALAVLCVSMFYEGQEHHEKENEAAASEKQVELELVYAYQNPQWNSAIERMVSEFEEAYPDIKVSYEVSYENKVYEDILSKKIARNELGDIVQLKTPEAYAASGTLGVISDDISDLVTSVYTYDGNVYGVGAVEATTGVIYNKDIFEKYGLKEPETYEDFLNICKKLERRGVTPVGVGGSDLWHMEYWVNHFFRTDVLAGDEDWLKRCSAGEAAWTDPEPAAMMHHLCELFQSGYVNADWLTTADASLSYKMTEGEIAMVYTGPWTAVSIQKLSADMNLGWFYIPDEEGVVYAGDNRDTFWSVTKSCAEDEEKYEAAMTFLSYFYSLENYSDLCRSTYTFPLSREGMSDDAPTAREGIREDIIQSFRNADSRIPVYIGNEDTPEEFEKAMLQIVQEVLAGETGEEDGLERIQSAWEQLNVQEAGS